MIIQEKEGDIAILAIDHGKANALDVELLAGLKAELGAHKNTPVRAIMLTGKDGFFSAGVDLFRLLDGGQDYVDLLLRQLDELLLELITHPKPIVAAINGHAIAGGCILAAACDYRIMAQGRGRIGVTELSVGVPFPALAFEIMRTAVPGNFFTRHVLLGDTYEPQQALTLGLIHEAVEAPLLLHRAKAIAARLGSISKSAFSLTKRQIHSTTLDRVSRFGIGYEKELREQWMSPETHRFIREYLRQVLGKKRQ